MSQPAVGRILRLDNAIRPYAWGSPTVIPTLLDQPPTGEPAAELWVGAHPGEPSRWVDDPRRPGLDELIAAAPLELLGARTVEQFGPQLPFLLKLLAADKCLSLQVHPNAEQAREGFALEQERGIPPAAPERNYSDPHHKPELLCALTDFEALCGFRPLEQTLALLDTLIGRGAHELAMYRDLIAAPDGLRAAFTTRRTLPGPARAELVAAVVTACQGEVSAAGPWSGPARASLLAAADFPGDVGVAVALLLNYVRLEPGQAIFLGAGNVHAYLRGVCVEILANSDNVLRCGLTPKHIDVPELLRIARLEPLAHPLSPVSVVSASESVYPVPVPDFELTVLTPAAGVVQLEGDRPWLLIATQGSVTVGQASGLAAAAVPVAQGHAVFIAAGADPVEVSGTGRAHVASVGPRI
ncbi:MAG: mannose-6-phosphate isomerase, class [Frankiales bacterium]|nr:mannose-6-phosphate isomerase, class [Frankiales bacterium]